MTALKELYEARAEIYKEIRRLADLSNDESHDWTSEHERQWTEANSDYDQLSSRIERSEKAESIQQEMAKTAATSQERAAQVRNEQPTGEPGGGVLPTSREKFDVDEFQARRRARAAEQAIALQAWCRSQSGIELTDEHLRVCRKLRINPGAAEFTIELRRDSYANVRREMRALSTAATEGGDTIPEGFVNNFERALLAFGGVRQVADVIRTASGNDLPWPTVNDTSNKGALLAENTQVSAQDIVTAATTFNAYKYTSKLIRVSVELLQDSAFDLANELGSILGERIGRITNEHFTTGTGTAQPKGIVVASTQGATYSIATGLAATDILTLVHSVDPAYRQGAGFMMHDAMQLIVRKIVDGNSQFLWQPGLQLGQPDRLVGYPVTTNQDMDGTPANGDKVVLFGQLSKYKIRDVAGLRLRRLVEHYADYDQEGFVAFSRHDGDLLNAGTNPVKHLAATT